MARTPQQERLFESAGQFETTDALTVFLYHLMRDELPAGTVAQAVREATENLTGSATITNGYLGRYAEFLAGELRASSGAQALTEQQAGKTMSRFSEVGEERASPTAAHDDAPDMTPTLGPGPHPERYDCHCAPCVGKWGAR